MKYGREYLIYQIKGNILRRSVRQFYLRNVLKKVKGKTIDFGCGAGELLGLLPDGSIGLEVNRYAVKFCRDLGLEVFHYNPGRDKYALKDIEVGRFETMVISHVLEHLRDPKEVITNLTRACNRVGIHRLVVVVPDKKGFTCDKTHRTFIDYEYLVKNDLVKVNNFIVVNKKLFPFNFGGIGNFFRHNELVIIYDNCSDNVI